MLYLENGYVNMEYIMHGKSPFAFVIGGRGTGKTYTALKTLIQANERFILMRRTQTQLDNVCNTDLSPFKPINMDLGINIEPLTMGKNTYKFCYVDYDDEGKKLVKDCVAYAIALSTVSNLRGFSAADADYLIYDEFIPERHERPLKEECIAFLNCIETINRNRELQNRKPIKVICLANANDFANPLFIGLGLVRVVENMLEKKKTEYTNSKRGISIYLLTDSPISVQKANTALYRLGNRDFTDMAIRNVFANFDDDNIKSEDLKQFKPRFGLGELCVYEHKSKPGYYYVCGHYSGTIPIYPPTREGANNLRYKHKTILSKFLLGQLHYESHFDRALLEKYLTL